MRYQDTAIFTDLDGTLFNSDSAISRENLAAIETYTAQGGLFAIATGRSFDNAVYYMKTLVPQAPSIVLNGSAVYDPATGQCPYHVAVDHDAVLQVLQWCNSHFPDMDIQVYGTRTTYYITPREKATMPLVEQLQPCVFSSLKDILSLPWLKTLHYGLPEQTEALYAYLLDTGLVHRVSIVRAITGIPPYDEHIELLPREVNKGSALNACRSLPCYRGRKLIAVGDYINDLELLQQADLACCPSNACREIREISDRILVSNDDHAIRDLIDSVIPDLP